MCTSTLELVLASYPEDYSVLVAELWCQHGMFAAIRLQNAANVFSMEFFSVPSVEPVFLDLAEVESLISRAKRRLKEIEGVKDETKEEEQGTKEEKGTGTFSLDGPPFG